MSRALKFFAMSCGLSFVGLTVMWGGFLLIRNGELGPEWLPRIFTASLVMYAVAGILMVSGIVIGVRNRRSATGAGDARI
jgi:hypothetical protein